MNGWHPLLLSLKAMHPVTSSVPSHISLVLRRSCLLLPWMVCSFKSAAVVWSPVSLLSFLPCHCLFTILHVCWRWLVLSFLGFLFLLPSSPLLSWFTIVAQLTPQEQFQRSLSTNYYRQSRSLMLSQRAQGTIPVQSVCKTLTCNNQLFSKRKSKSCGRESGVWFVFHSPLNCALAAPSEPSLGRH